MRKPHAPGRNPDALALPDSHRRSALSPLFILSLGVLYPGFLCLIFLRPDLFEQLFSASSGYVITGIGLTLLGLCFVLATMHFRAADRQYRQTLDTPTHPLPTSNEETQHHANPSHGALLAHKHNHPGE